MRIGLRPAALLAAVFAVLAVSSFVREAKAQDPSRYAAIVIDVNTGEVMFSRNADARRHPASITKVMTLYILFEELDAGRISETTRMQVSARAAAQQPSRLGLRAGSSITVRDAILALVTKSANDVAVVIAEHISGSERAFARRMTETARRMGMASTTYRNASGLPNSEQVTTARDLSILGRAIRERFPRRFQVFSTRSFTYAGRTYRNHNRLLGRVSGVDGIKTGYIRASGFNLLTTARQGDRQIVAVVLGGNTGRWRDRHMGELVRRFLPRASARRTAPQLFVRSPYEAPNPVMRETVLVASAPAIPPAPVVAPADTQIMTASVTVPLPVPAPEPEAVGANNTTAPAGILANEVPSEGWTIQIGALPSEREAVALLGRARQELAMLSEAAPYTQPVAVNGGTLYRARFGGFDARATARAACANLERRGYACLAVRPDR
ncbi:MAG: D-alanyl-D-alanine carboxypeptidase [Hyphomicrobiaceae bacterium]|nr:D-alanyl-D-alanine carboxypeptidase [Hyphomicrobiaceae bacterium]